MRAKRLTVIAVSVLLMPWAAGQAPHPVSLPAGAIVGPLDPDATLTLTVSGLSPGVCFVDDDGSGAYEAGEALYLDVSSATCAGPIAGSDVRLTAGAEKPAGSLIRPGDAEYGVPSGGALNDDLRFLDADGDGAFGPGDALFIDLVNAGASRVDVGDLRLSGFGTLPALHVVRSGDADQDWPLLELPTPMDVADFGALAYVDVEGDGTLGVADTLYVDLDGTLIFPLLGTDVPVASDLRLTAFGPYAPGGVVGPMDLDSVAVYRVTGMAGAITGNLCFVDDNSDAVYEPEEELLFHLAGACPAQSGPTDVRLADGPAPAGSVVRSSDDDNNVPLLAANDDLRFFDADGNGAFGPGDALYIDINNAGASRVDVGDLRLTASGALAAMQTVRAGDVDLDRALSEIGAGVDTADANVLAFLDVVSDAHFGNGDLAYLNTDAGGFPEAPGVGDVRLAGLPPAFGPGSVLGPLDPEVRPRVQFAGLAPAPCWLDDNGNGAFDVDEPVLLDTVGTCARVAPNDLRLTGPAAGQAVRPQDADAYAPLAGPLNDDLRFVDRDGSGTFGPGDALVLDVMNAGASRVDVGDVRLTPFDALPAFRGVRDGDADLNMPLAEFPAAQGGARDLADAGAVGFVDNDADAAYTLGDTLYLNRDLTVAFDQPVSIGDVRLMGAMGLSYLPAPAAPPTVADAPAEAAPTVAEEHVSEMLGQLAQLNVQLNGSLAQNTQLGAQLRQLQEQLSGQSASLRDTQSALASIQQGNDALRAKLASPPAKATPGFEAGPLLLVALAWAALRRR